MSELVERARLGEITVLTINNPPVNALSRAVVAALENAFDQAVRDPEVKAIVITGAGRNFIAGADINEFAAMRASVLAEISQAGAPLLSALPSLVDHIEDSPKPVVMAIHGSAFGGGLELAIAGHYRVASPGAQFAQPEVKLGLIPGAGGAQRLPRLVGIAKALDMCWSGNPIAAEDALRVGLVDQIVQGELLQAAIAFARDIAGKPFRKTRERTDKIADKLDEKSASSAETTPLFAAARAEARKRMRGQTAPLAAIDAVEAATRLPFAEGIARERELFLGCLRSQQSRALIHVFFGEREVAKLPSTDPGRAPAAAPPVLAPVERAAVIGAGTMGGGIAMVFANAGIPVLLKETGQSALDRGLATIQKNYAGSVKRGRFTPQFVEERLRLIQPVLSYEGFAEADIVIEAVFENMALKKQIFSELDRIAKPSAILASNTSTLSIDEIASATSRPPSVIGTHFFSPANVMRLLEIVRGKETSDQAIAACMALAKRLGKVGVVVGNCFGFVGNRMFQAYRREAQFLVEEGAAVEEVDAAMVEFGMAMGPLATADLAGLDVGWRIRKENPHLRRPGVRHPLAEDRLCEMGRFGQKTGAGWYRYDENRRALPDHEVQEMVRRWATEAKGTNEAGIAQRDIPRQEIVDRLIFTLVNEGARVLQEGIARRAVDIDIIYVSGYGFPAWRGGPMWYADSTGLKHVLARVEQFHRQHGELWAPAPLLQNLASAGGAFSGRN